MLFEDEDGKILTMEEVNSLMFWELSERNIHTYRERKFDEKKFTHNGFSDLNLSEQEYSPYYDVLDEDM